MSGLFGGKTKNTTTNITTPGVATQLSPLYNFNSSVGSTGAATFANASSGGFATGYGNGTFAGLQEFNANNKAGISRVGNLIGNLNSNQNPFIQARVNPLRDKIGSARADLSRSLTQRGVTGSLGNNELMKFDNNANRQLGDASAQATQESLQSLISAEGLSGNLNEGQMNLANEYLKRDLAGLGLNMEAAQIALSGRQFSEPGSTTTTNNSTKTRPGIGSILTGIGSFASGIGSLKTAFK